MVKIMKRLRLSNSSRRFLINIRFLAVAAIILWIASRLIVGMGKNAVSSLHFILRYPSVSYDGKMRKHWGNNYTLFKFVKENTPPSATIMHPPQVRPWKNAGNGTLMQYFLYPRKFRSGSLGAPAVDNEATHVLVAWGEWWVKDRRWHGWPKFPVNMRRFYHLPITRKILVDELGVSSSLPGISSKLSQENIKHPPQLLENYISDAEKKVEHHQQTKVGNHLVEFIQLSYTFNSYDYWMKTVDLPLTEKTVVKARIRSNIRHAVNLVAEVKYGSGKLAIFGSSPNGKENLWEPLIITDLYQRARGFALATGWSSKEMRITRIGVNTGFPREMPYLEKYGVIELEKGQPGIKENTDPKINNAPHFLKMANYYRAKEQFEKAIKYYQLAEKLNPVDAWTHCSLGDIHTKMGQQARAVKEYEKAIKLQPNIAWFHFALGKVYKGQGRADLAIESFKKAVELDPSSIWAHNALEDLPQGKSNIE